MVVGITTEVVGLIDIVFVVTKASVVVSMNVVGLPASVPVPKVMIGLVVIV